MKHLLLTLFLSCSFCLFGQSIDTLSIRAAIERQMAAYPESTLQDIYKSFYQDRFGPGHMISDTASARSYLMRELSEMADATAVYYEPTGSEGRFVRVYLSAVADGLITADQLLDAFVRSANMVKESEIDWEAEWKAIVSIITKYGIQVNGFETDAPLLDEASRNGQAVHHSRAYNTAYHPHYRIVERGIFEKELLPLIVFCTFAPINKPVMDAKEYIQKLGLTPHPEGGWYRQVYGNDENSKKRISTIYYMLCDEDFSAFHRLHDVVEIWYYHAGEPLDIYVITPDGELTIHHLSADAEMQVVIEPEQWFAAELPGKKGFSLVGCAVAPAFTFENFELANKKDLLHDFPQHKALIERMCR